MVKSLGKVTYRELALLGIIIYLVSMMTSGFVLPAGIKAYGDVAHRKLGCEGVDKFYTGEGFYEDYFHMYNYYVSCEGEDDLSMQEIGDIVECKVDPQRSCEDFSHAVKCLGEKYGIDCVFRGEMIYGREMMSHLGVECEVGGEWSDFY